MARGRARAENRSAQRESVRYARNQEEKSESFDWSRKVHNVKSRLVRKCLNLQEKMGWPMGLEPTTTGITILFSNPKISFVYIGLTF